MKESCKIDFDECYVQPNDICIEYILERVMTKYV